MRIPNVYSHAPAVCVAGGNRRHIAICGGAHDGQVLCVPLDTQEFRGVRLQGETYWKAILEDTETIVDPTMRRTVLVHVAQPGDMGYDAAAYAYVIQNVSAWPPDYESPAPEHAVSV